MTRLAALLAPALVVLTLTPAARGQTATVLTRIPNESAVSSWGGVTAVSVLVNRGGVYRLAVIRGRRRTLLPVPSSPVPFDVDVGPDSTGAPALVYPRCRHDAPGRCRVVIHWLDRRGEVPVSTTDGAGHEAAPALWRGRIAWVAGGRLLTRSRLVRRSIPPRELIRARDGADLENIELRPPNFAVQVGTTEGGYQSSEIRAGQIDADRTRHVAELTSGEGGQTILGLSLNRRDVGWYVTCFGDPEGCTEVGGAHRQRLSDRSQERAQGAGPLAGFALTDGTALGLDGGREAGDDPAELIEAGIALSYLCQGARGGGARRGCALIRFDGLHWRAEG